MLKLPCAAAIVIASATAAQPIRVHGETPGHTCTAARTDRYLGRLGTRAMAVTIKRASNAAVLRWSPPHTMLTMDYRADRVTVWVDRRRRITRIACG